MTCDLPEKLIGDDAAVDIRVAPDFKMNDAARRRDIRHFDNPTAVVAFVDVQSCQPSGDRRRFGELDVEVDRNASLAGGRLLR